MPTSPHCYESSPKLIIGLTGGIGSGKTVATDWLATQGIDIIDADVIAHQIVQKGHPTLSKIKAQFGDWVINEQGELNRQALREHVFNHPTALAKLEDITHPAIRAEATRQLAHASSAYVVLSAPLLLESGKAGLKKLCHHIVVIDTPEAQQLERASQRDGQTSEKIKTIMSHQLSRQERNHQADDIILNDGSLEALYDKLARLHDKLISQSKTV